MTTQDDGSPCDLAHDVPYLTEEGLFWACLEVDLVALAGPAYQPSFFESPEFSSRGTGARPNRTRDASQVYTTVGGIHDHREDALTDLGSTEQQ